MLWLCLNFTNLPIELRESRPAECSAVTDRIRSRRLLIAVSPAAATRGILVGQDATTALVRVPDLKLLDRSLTQEKAALKALAAWALQFSSEVTFDDVR